MQEENTATSSPVGFWRKNWVQNTLWVIAAIVFYLAARPFMQGDVAEGVAPDFQMTSLTGKPVNLEDYRGKPVLLQFWATWCPICAYEREGIEKVAEDYPVINIATQSGDNSQLLAFARQNGMNPDIIVNDADGSLMAKFGARAVPATFILDKDGQIRFVEVGFSTSFGLKARLWWLQ
ncbi:MAG: protein disulfide oxidoreductase [Hydrogenovibrio sp.]|nr:protein disulfide oxidoreductase [Hydrogenovibrio sp.]